MLVQWERGVVAFKMHMIEELATLCSCPSCCPWAGWSREQHPVVTGHIGKEGAVWVLVFRLSVTGIFGSICLPLSPRRLFIYFGLARATRSLQSHVCQRKQPRVSSRHCLSACCSITFSQESCQFADKFLNSALVNFCQPDTNQSYLGRGKFEWDDASIRRACKQVCGVIFLSNG